MVGTDYTYTTSDRWVGAYIDGGFATFYTEGYGSVLVEDGTTLTCDYYILPHEHDRRYHHDDIGFPRQQYDPDRDEHPSEPANWHRGCGRHYRPFSGMDRRRRRGARRALVGFLVFWIMWHRAKKASAAAVAAAMAGAASSANNNDNNGGPYHDNPQSPPMSRPVSSAPPFAAAAGGGSGGDGRDSQKQQLDGRPISSTIYSSGPPPQEFANIPGTNSW
ncbi:hypothetical protein PG988_013676 [Apiospora saccharicola]